MAICNPAKSGVITPALQRAYMLKQALNAVKPTTDPVRQMSRWQYWGSSFSAIDSLATTWKELVPYVKALEIGEQIRSTLNMDFSKVMRRVADLDTKQTRDITRIMEVEDAEGRLAKENADGSATITAQEDHVGVKKGEVVVLPKALNDVRKEMRGVIDTLYSKMVEATKVAMGYGPNDPVTDPDDKARLAAMESFRKAGYLPHIRTGRWALQYTLGGEKHFESYGFDIRKGFKGGGRNVAEERRQALLKMGATEVSPVLDMQQRAQLLEEYLPTLNNLSKMDILFQSILTPKNKGAAEEVKKILDSLREEAQAPSPRLRKRDDVKGWLREDNYDTYLRSIFSPFVASTSDWVANKATEPLRQQAISSIKDDNLRDIAKAQEDYIHSDESKIAQMKSTAFLYTLGFNLSSALVNFTQLMHTSLPFLGGAGGAGRAVAALTKAVADIAGGGRLTLDPDRVFDIDKMKLTQDEKEFLREMYRRGVAEALLTRDQAPAYMGKSQIKEVYAAGQVLGRIMETASLAFTMVEQVNRLSTGLAAYRMARDKKTLQSLQKMAANVNQDVVDATDAGIFAVKETQFVTSKPFRARAMHGMPGGVGLQFMAFPIKMLGFFLRASKLYGGGRLLETPEGRRMTGLLVMGILSTSGIWGLPFVAPAGDLLDWLTKMLGKELGLTPTATKVFLRDTLKEIYKELPILNAVGTPAELADYTLNGPFRATGIDISRRTALDIIDGNPFSMDIFNFGPLGGAVAGGVRDFFNYRSKGEDMMAVASLLPIAARNVARAFAMQESGYITPGRMEPALPARELQEPGDFAKVALGFTPTKVARAREALEETKQLQERTDDLRKSYSDSIATAMNKYYNTKDPSHMQEAQRLRQEVLERDRGKPLQDRIIRDPSAFNSSIAEKLKKMQYPQTPEKVSPPFRPYYMERVREG
jgi:hypothetical protein